MNALRLLSRTGAIPPESAAYEAIVAAARHPRLYAVYGVPDTVDGRFDMIILHLFLLLERLKDESSTRFSQALVDVMFRDMDGSLREMGASDPSVPKKVRRMAEVYAGRIAAYKASVADQAGFIEALRRNVFADGPGDARRLAHYTWQNQKVLAEQNPRAISRGSVTFIEPA